MLKYHITDNYEVARCTAEKVACKYEKVNDITHFLNEEDAQAKIEELLHEKFGSKKVKKENDSETTSYHEISTKEDGTSVFLERHKPSIYGFISTKLNEANDAYIVKVGYTSRTVPQRMKEWQDEGGIYSPEYFQLDFELPAVIKDPENNKEYYVMDHNFHKYFEKNGFQKLIDREFDSAGHDKKKISKEFYIGEDGKRSITREIIDECVADQEENLHNGGSGYTFYDENTSQRTITQYRPTLDFQPRSFQNEVINKTSSYFLNEKDEDDNKKFLLTAPTRSGKSFMAAQTLLKTFNEAKENNPEKKNHCAVVVSGFAEIEDEWKKTFQTHKDFNQKEYGTAETNKCGQSPCVCSTKFKYLSKMDLENNPKAVEEAYASGAENVVVFFTLQDLAGSTSGTGVKAVHKFLDTPGSVDMLLGDEAHLAMFTEDGRYQEVLNGYSNSLEDNEKIDNAVLNSSEEIQSSKRLKQIAPTIGSLFISATPYNVLSNTAKFDIDKNVIIIPEEQIIDEQKTWEDNNKDKEVWESPYYGIPTKKFFGLDVGITAGKLFSPIDKQDGTKGFKHPQQIKQVISGLFGRGGIAPNIMKDTNFEAAGIGNHIYMTLPYCSSCDAMETELNNFLKKNGLTDEYEILNISSVDKKHNITKLSSNEINSMITNSNKKTITLTVDRMGTGVTQEKWDTVIMMRGMSSAQKYDQVAGRCGTPYVKTYETTNTVETGFCQECKVNNIRESGKKLCQECFDKGGETLEEQYKHKTIKDNPKPNVAIVTFDPNAMVNFARNRAVSLAGNEGKTTDEQTSGEDVEENLGRSLDYIEHFVYSKDKAALQQLNKHNIMSVVLQGMKNKSVGDIADTLRVHNSLNELTPESKEALLNVRSQHFKKDDKTSVTSSIEVRDDGYCWIEDCDDQVRPGSTKKGNLHRLCEYHFEAEAERRAALKEYNEEDPTVEEENTEDEINDSVEARALRDEQNILEEKIKTSYSRALFYAMLSNTDFSGLRTLIDEIKQDLPSKKNGFVEGRAAELARHTGVDVEILEIIRDNNIGGLDFDDAIKQMGRIISDDTEENVSGLSKRDKFTVALRSFSMLSSNERLTSREVSEMLNDKLSMSRADWRKFKKSPTGTVDVGCKSAINLVEFYERGLKNGLTHDDLKKRIFSVPTSAMSYELISKVYDAYGWDKKNIMFVDNVNNSTMMNALSLAKEMVQCHAKDPSTCYYHKNSSETKEKLADEYKNIFGKIKDNKTKKALRVLMNNVGSMPKFDYVISNPPYQEEREGTSAANIYPRFILDGSVMGNVSVMIHPARAFFGAGRVNKEQVESITSNQHFSVDLFEKQSDKIFPGTDIKGGVMITRFDLENTRDKNSGFTNLHPQELIDVKDKVNEAIDFVGIDKSIEIYSANNITEAAKITAPEYFAKSSNPNNLVTSIFKNVPELFEKDKSIAEGYTPVLGRTDNRETRWIKNEYINVSPEWKNSWKVFLPNSSGNGFDKGGIGIPVVAGPGVISTQTFINMGMFKTQQEAKNCEKYVKTKFVRAMLSLLKVTQHNAKGTWKNVPMQDFTSNSKIDWSKSVSEIDEQLFESYKLTNDERSWIRENMREMN